MNTPGGQGERDHASLVDEVVRRTLAAADAQRAVSDHADRILEDLAGVESVTLIAVGKAAAGMTRGAMPLLRDRIAGGVVVIPRGASGRAGDPGPLPAFVEVLTADHPTPTEASVHAGERVAAAARQASCLYREPQPSWHAVVLLISGGASALMAAPREGLTIDDVAQVADALMRAGAGIDELNTARRRLDRLKGGGLARLAAPAPVFTYAISDVLGDDLRTIGSGPGVPDATTDADALAVLEGRGVVDASPSAAALLRAGAARAGTHAPMGRNGIAARVLLSSAACLESLRLRLADLGDVVEVRTGVAGEARDEARAFVHRLARIAREPRTASPRPRLVLWGGETTVTVRGGGVGGRNQEFALAAALAADELGLAGRPDAAASLLIASFGTDGVDGPTDVAGAFVTESTAATSRTLGLDPAGALAANDAHSFFAAMEARGLRCLVRTGPTGTNVNDVTLGAVWT